MKCIRPLYEVLCFTALAALLSIGLAGCQGLGLPPRTHAPAEGVALQPDGLIQGVVDTGDLTVAYAYAVTFEPKRQLYLSGRVRKTRFQVDSVTVYLHLLDSSGHLIDRSVLYASGNRRDVYFRRPRTFDITLKLPDGVAAIAFSSYVKLSSGRR